MVDRLARSVLLPGFAGTTAPDWLLREVADGLGGVVLFGRNVTDDEQVAALTARLRGERDGVVVGIDEEGGDVTRLDAATGSRVPGPLALGAVGDPALTRRVAGQLAARLAACGVTVNLAPSADLTLHADDPIIGVRSFGSDPRAVAGQVAAFVRGTQGEGVAACAKHFPGHGASTTDSHFALPALPREDAELRAAELVPFAAAVEAGVRAVMPGHLVVPSWGELPATLNPRAITGVLRGELGFTGTVITDALEMAAVAGSLGDVDGLAQAAVAALVAGADALCVGGETADAAVVARLVDAIGEAVKAGTLPEERLAEASARVAALGAAPAPVSEVDPALGLAAARRAVRVRGEARLAAAPVVVDVEVPPTMAAGPVPWGLGSHLAELVPGTAVVRVAGGDEPAVEPGRQVVLVTRDAHRHADVAALVTRLAADREVVHVETGVPGPELGAVATIDTHGGSYVSLRAAAELLAASAD
ncbi:glycoside hydrolase family 3 N-terminal domain-containing protein [Amycolatopsis suaedae]|uniref:Glycoside hydrolase family 3 protein n=1 Tax=Amycolatopsis suaedae TaxID=2510978 RepID=A0A4V2EMQ1_9PSEU|nr:glycoside hydrolase family 3 N-terminal domain-containing protein [Amycolatopsis suaedae]RZQ65885.1 glycoside hydrolase family 3 protein [Amycolatopsis suaedae]